MDVELAPEQPEEVRRAVADLLTDEAPAPDPWWQAGLDEALEPFARDSSRAPGYGDVTARPRSTRGAERA